MSTTEEEKAAVTKEPKDRAITQQSLPAWKPVLSPHWVLFIFMAITIILIPVGVVCLIYGLKMGVKRKGSLSTLNIKEDGIAYPSDIKYRFANYTPVNFNPELNQFTGGGQINPTPKLDQRFINWVRLSALPKFRKLWGIIDSDLKSGDVITVNIINQWNSYSFDGKKSIVLSTTTWLGGHNIFLGCVYLVTGGLSLMMGIIYSITILVKPRPANILDMLHR